MIPLRVALIHRKQWYRGSARTEGQFAYQVPEFTWQHIGVEKDFMLDLNNLAGDYDLAWLDPGKYDGGSHFRPRRGARQVPVVYYSVYPTLSQGHLKTEICRARDNADLALLDHDDSARWTSCGLPVKRCAYSVNESYYRPRGVRRDIDVGFYCVFLYNPARPAMDAWLEDFCGRKGYVYRSTRGLNIRTLYAERLARTKVVVHLNRTSRTRPPRIFDVAASGAALLSNPMPPVSGELWRNRVHYVAFGEPHDEYSEKDVARKFDDKKCREVIGGLEWLLDEGHWEAVADSARQYVLTCHTWRQRARELRGTLLDTFPALRERTKTGWMYQ